MTQDLNTSSTRPRCGHACINEPVCRALGCIEGEPPINNLVQSHRELLDSLRELDARLRACFGDPITAEEAYDSFYQDMVQAAITNANKAKLANTPALALSTHPA